MSESQLLSEINAGVARITINNPSRLNALSMEMVAELLAALDNAERNARVIVLTGAGRAFCSGANLSAGSGAGQEGIDAGALLKLHFNPLMMKIRDLSIPLITAVNGAAAGYGASLALAGDLIVASEQAYFLESFRNVGLTF